jgi:hypothetical protein
MACHNEISSPLASIQSTILPQLLPELKQVDIT